MVYYASAEWCGPCKAFRPLVQATAAELGIQINHVDVDRNPDFAKQHGISSVPTLLVINPGTSQVAQRRSGAMSKAQLVQFLSSAR